MARLLCVVVLTLLSSVIAFAARDNRNVDLLAGRPGAPGGSGSGAGLPGAPGGSDSGAGLPGAPGGDDFGGHGGSGGCGGGGGGGGDGEAGRPGGNCEIIYTFADFSKIFLPVPPPLPVATLITITPYCRNVIGVTDFVSKIIPERKKEWVDFIVKLNADGYRACALDLTRQLLYEYGDSLGKLPNF